MHRRRPSRTEASILPAASLAILLAACAAEPSGDALDADAVPTLTLVEELRLGSVDDPEVGFTFPGNVDVDRDGRIYVLEAQDAQIRVFDAEGRRVGTIGRRGSGPGEFQDVSRFGLLGDTVWTIDQRLRRITLFKRDGTLISTGQIASVMVPLTGVTGVIAPLKMRGDGLFTSDMTSVIRTRETQHQDVADPDSIRAPIVLFAATGEVVDTVAWRRLPAWAPGRTASRPLEIGGGRYSVPQPESDSPLTIVLDDGTVEIDRALATDASRGIFTVTRLTFDGDTVYHRSFRYQPVAYADEWLDSLAWRRARGPSNADSAMVFRRIRAAMSMPQFQPPVYQVAWPWLDDDGSLWLRREETPGDTQRWLVLDADGTPRGQVLVPKRILLGYPHGDVLWAAELGEFDVPWVVRYRLQSRRKMRSNEALESVRPREHAVLS